MKILIGDILKSTCSTLVNTVNCVGVMGKGIAKEFKEKYPEMFEDYVLRCEKKEVKPGEPYPYYDLLSGTMIINFHTKDHWRSASRLDYVIKGLDWFADNYNKLNIESVAFPPLGCGNGGLEWMTVGPIMYRKLKDLPIEVEIYAPYSATRKEISVDFLENSVIKTSNVKGYKLGSYNKYWNLLLYSIQQLNNDRYSLHVGRTIYQKICYILTAVGIPTGFVFSKSEYGLFSPEAKNALLILANNNLINEETKGKMIEINVSESFVLDKNAFSSDDFEKVNKALDLFYRFKNTESAEIIASILFASSELKNSGSVNADKLMHYLQEWKPRWNNDEYRNLLMEYSIELASMKWLSLSN